MMLLHCIVHTSLSLSLSLSLSQLTLYASQSKGSHIKEESERSDAIVIRTKNNNAVEQDNARDKERQGCVRDVEEVGMS